MSSSVGEANLAAVARSLGRLARSSIGTALSSTPDSTRFIVIDLLLQARSPDGVRQPATDGFHQGSYPIRRGLELSSTLYTAWSFRTLPPAWRAARAVSSGSSPGLPGPQIV